MISKLFLSVLLGWICLGYVQQQDLNGAAKLILFVSEDQPLIGPDEILSVEALADELGLQFILKDDKEGLPQEIATLPAIYFQDTKGRSRYYGRYTNYSRIKNFVRTAKMFHSGNATSMKKDILVWKNEKAKIYAPVKVTELAGIKPEGFDHELFVREVQEAIAGGMHNFELKGSEEQAKHARSFYFNIYPYLDEWDNLSVTYELFSQYNCIKPISQKLDPIIPAFHWSQRYNGFNEIGQIIEKDILRQIETSISGDAFVAVPATINELSWEEIGLGLVEVKNSQTQQSITTNIPLARKWKVEQEPQNDDPIIIFSFLSPVDNYAGEVTSLDGELVLDENITLEDATGSFTVDIADVTMGAEDFDDSVQNKMLKRALFPKAHFEFVKVEGADGNLTDGQVQKINVVGNFTMMGISIPVTVETIIEPIQVEGVIKLAASCRFQIPLFEKFQVKGPDGPSPAKDILQFYMQFNLIENQ